MRRLAIALLLSACTTAAPRTAPAPAPAAVRTTTVLLVRHAERAAEPAGDPGITAEGEARARALVDVARAAGVQAIITTQYQRTRLTAQPTASALGITPEVVEARGADHAQAVARAVLERHAGRTVLVVGHSNTLPAIATALGAQGAPPIADAEYDNLWVVTLADGAPPRFERRTFGAGR